MSVYFICDFIIWISYENYIILHKFYVVSTP